jgi:hypothetical protein
MESWWELGEWSGHSGNTLQVWRLTCPFCKEQGNFGLAYHAEKQKANSQKKLNFDLYQCRNCMAYVHVQMTMRDKGAVGKDLYNEIEDLATKGDLPPLMKDWSHEVRVLGNDSAHPKPNAPPATPEDARDVVQFLDSLLLYLYDFPKKISDYRQRRNPATPVKP